MSAAIPRVREFPVAPNIPRSHAPRGNANPRRSASYHQHVRPYSRPAPIHALTSPPDMCTIVINSTWRFRCAPAHPKRPALMVTLPKPLPTLPNFPRGKRTISTRNLCCNSDLRVLEGRKLLSKKSKKGSASQSRTNNPVAPTHPHRACINMHNLHNHIRPFVASIPCCHATYDHENSARKSPA